MPTTPHQLPLYVIYPSKKSRAGLVVCSLSCATRWATATGKPFMIRSTPPGGSCAYCVGCGMRQHLPDRCLFHGANPCQPTDWTQSIAAAPIIHAGSTCAPASR